MFVRRMGRPMEERALRRLAAKMCAAFGTGRFLLDPHGQDEDDRWGRSGQHALVLAPTVRQKLTAMAADLAEHGAEAETWWPAEERALLARSPPDAPLWEQDGPTIVGGGHEHFIKVRLVGLYYGVGYERGDWLFLRSLAEFLERNLPDGKVWYGGDSSGVLAGPLDAAARRKLDEHFYGRQQDYPAVGRRSARECGFCGGWPMMDISFGGDVQYLWCDGCDRREAKPRAGGDYVPIPPTLGWPVQLDLETGEFLVLRESVVIEDGKPALTMRFRQPDEPAAIASQSGDLNDSAT